MKGGADRADGGVKPKRKKRRGKGGAVLRTRTLAMMGYKGGPGGPPKACELVENGEPADGVGPLAPLMCPVCRAVLDAPIVLQCCGQAVCKRCWPECNEACPTCGTALRVGRRPVVSALEDVIAWLGLAPGQRVGEPPAREEPVSPPLPARPHGYAVIVADPPWAYTGKGNWAGGEDDGAAAHYATMSDRDLAALPVEEMAADTAMLLMWATWPRMLFVFELAAKWGFRFCSLWTDLVKYHAGSNKLFAGTGVYTPNNAEPLLCFTRGPFYSTVWEPLGCHRAKRVEPVLMEPVRPHSGKPGARVWAQLARVGLLQLPVLELFAREAPEQRADYWGFEAPPAATGPEAAGVRAAQDARLAGLLEAAAARAADPNYGVSGARVVRRPSPRPDVARAPDAPSEQQ